MIHLQVLNYLHEHSNRWQLVSELINLFKQNQDILLLHHEGFCWKQTGLYDIILSVCKQHNFDPNRIHLENNNMLQESIEPFNYKTPEYYLLPGLCWNMYKNYQFNIEWTERYVFSQFNRRFNGNRLYATWKLHNSNLKQYSISSFNSKPSIDNYDLEMFRWLESNPNKYADIKDFIPYSDIDNATTEFWNSAFDTLDWENIYKHIGLDIAYETVDYPDYDHPTLFLTEKTIRPLCLGTPCVIIANPFFSKHLQDVLDIDMFEDLFSLQHDAWGGPTAIDIVYDELLPRIIKDNIIKTIYTKHTNRLIHNQTKILDFCKQNFIKWQDNCTYYASQTPNT